MKMKIKISPEWLFLIVVSIGVILLLLITSFLAERSSVKSNAVIFNQLNVGLPVRIKIPQIEVDATIEYVGLTFDGAMNVPTRPMDVGWFNLGPRPGEEGNAVIDGHSGYKNNIPAVFDNLYKLRPGDRLYIEDDTGKTIVFVVRKIQKFNPNANALNIFSSNDGLAHLNLITCVGIWDKKTKSRSERLIVFSDRE